MSRQLRASRAKEFFSKTNPVKTEKELKKFRDVARKTVNFGEYQTCLNWYVREKDFG